MSGLAKHLDVRSINKGKYCWSYVRSAERIIHSVHLVYLADISMLYKEEFYVFVLLGES